MPHAIMLRLAGDRRIEQLAGWLILAMVVMSVANGLHGVVPVALAGGLAWCAGLLLFPRVSRAQRIQIVAMFAVGSFGIGWGLLHGTAIEFGKALTGNQAILTMLAAVSFLRLVALAPPGTEERLPRGRAAFWQTLFGVHLFGAVINFSAIGIVGDRLSAHRPLSTLQALTLSRGFCLAAHWSPFFAAMGVALTKAPGSQWMVMAAVGIPVVLVVLLLTGWQMSRRAGIEAFPGYPIRAGALALPLLLAAGTMAARHAWPEIPILTTIALMSLLVTLLLLLLRRGTAAGGELLDQVRVGLPRMSGEMALFLAAGVLAAGVTSLVATEFPGLTVSRFGPPEAAALLVLMTAVSVVGVHPVTSIAVASGVLLPSVSDPNLLGITFLMSWSAGVSISPFSGMHLGMQGRYGINPFGFLRWNVRFTLLLLLVDALALQLYGWLT